MDEAVAVALVAIIVAFLVIGMAYYTIARTKDNAILAESQSATAKAREVSDVIRNIALEGEASSSLAYHFSSGYITLLDDGTTVVQATVDDQTKTLAATPHSSLAYVGQYSIFGSEKVYPTGANDTAVADNPTDFSPIYYYSLNGQSYVISNNRVYLKTVQTQPNEVTVQIYLVTFASNQARSPPSGTMTFQSQTSTSTFTYNVYPGSNVTLTVTSGSLPSQDVRVDLSQLQRGGTVRIELNVVTVQLSYTQS